MEQKVGKVLIFNPSCEMAVRQDRLSYTPPRQIAQMEHDLSTLMMFVAEEGDAVVSEKPDEELMTMWRQIFGNISFATQQEACSLIKNGMRFSPWGHSKASFNRFGIMEKAKGWTWREILSRRSSVAVERKFAEIAGVRLAANPLFADDYETLQKAVEENLLEGMGIVVKSLWSASGRGVRFFSTEEREQAMLYGENCLRADGGVVVEKRLKRIAEFSFLFDFKGGETKYIGINRYHSTASGNMGWEVHGPQPYIYDLSQLTDEITTAAKCLVKALTEILDGSGYEGPVGVDAMIHEEADGKIGLRACTETNIRHCMGHVAKGVTRAFAPETSIRWRMNHFGDKGEWDEYCREQSLADPIKRDENGLITSGFFRLTPLGSEIHFGAFGWAGENGVCKEL